MSPETLNALNQGLREGARPIEPNGRQSIEFLMWPERLYHYFGGEATLSYQKWRREVSAHGSSVLHPTHSASAIVDDEYMIVKGLERLISQGKN